VPPRAEHCVLNLTLALEGITLHGLLVMLGLAVYATASHTVRQRRHPSAAIAWVISLVLLPYVALPLYLMFGRRKVVAHRRLPNFGPGSPAGADGMPPAYKTGQLASAMGLPNAVPFEQLVIHQDGRQALQCIRDMLSGARHSIDLCTFLLGRDALGDEIASRLMQRARDGVRVRLLIDGVGFYIGGCPNLKRLRAAGVQVTLFVSPLRSALRGRTNLRNHRKMLIVDGQWMWCGGRNLAAEYFAATHSPSGPKKAWVDLSFDLRGALVQQAVQRFDEDWRFAMSDRQATQSPPAMPALAGTEMGARLVASGPDQADDTIYTLLVSGCFTAQASIRAVTPYFVPDATLLMALTLAARRGIAVDLLMPYNSNHRLADIARHSALRELSSAGARVWLAPTMVHAKAVLIDDDLALVGSANLDERSLFLNYEMMVAFYDRSVVQDFAHWIALQQRGATPYRPRPPGLLREMVEGLVRWVAFQL
jgi:cardiolipin synthase